MQTLQRAMVRWPQLLALAVCAVLPFPARAQTMSSEPLAPPPAEAGQNSGPLIRRDVSLVLVDMTVTDPNDRIVTGLEKEDFHVFEDGREQEIIAFSSEDAPISIGVIFDMSGSMSDKIGRARQAAVQFLKTANPSDEFFMVSFNDRAELRSHFTSNVEELQSQMLFTAAKGRTALLDAIYLGLTQMRTASNRRRALLVISDGGDNHSRYSEKDIRDFMKEADCQLYVMGVFDKNDQGRSYEELYGPTLLFELAEMTGGRVFPVPNVNDLPDIASKISAELRNQYVLGYKPDDAKRNGTWRKIKVKLKQPKGLPSLNVYARTGYRAPTE